MSTGLLLGADEQVMHWLLSYYSFPPVRYDRALGILKNDQLMGAVVFHYYNGTNVELSYYGKGTMTAGVVRSIARFILTNFNPSRLSVLTSKRNKRYIRAFQKLGFRLEGTSHRYYGARESNRNTAVRFVMFRERIEELARIDAPLKKVS